MNAKQIKEIQDKGIITALMQACHEKLTNIHTCCNKFDNGMCSYKSTDYLIKELNEIEKHTGDIRTLLGLLKNKKYMYEQIKNKFIRWSIFVDSCF